ncbi:carbohydrate kinase family protein [Seohaeicola zhoushanensis]|uniref:Carbohydrate kinase n=1 Tax=Seohaeicola zhoushanensis TaxID=1569283 RepID=A0A8J3GYH8_9RHOB|nr:carbohydrate kinase [Seohaeicola zhoushanensis]GHF56994.1 carbohydrate kinase [Seohaeicola zhoushanensis]
MILCCGEALIDMIPTALPDGTPALVPHAGGAALNLAIALGRLGAPAGLFTGLSRDLFGRQLETALRASHVDPTLAIRSDRPTTLAFVEVVNGSARYTFYDENTAGRMLSKADLPDLPDAVSTLTFGGISLIHAPAAETYAALARREAGRRCIVVDPNIRPGFVTDEPAYRARLSGLLAQADIVKVSDEDLDWLLPGAQDGIADLLAQGPALVIVTKGDKGALAAHRAGWQVAVAAPRVPVVDTVGAGDTFLAGTLGRAHESGLLSRTALNQVTPDAMTEILAFATQAAAVTVARAGANPPWRHELL